MMGGQSGLAHRGEGKGSSLSISSAGVGSCFFLLCGSGCFLGVGSCVAGVPGAAAERSARRLRGGEAPSCRRRGHDAILGMYGQGTLPPPFVDPVVVREGTASQ